MTELQNIRQMRDFFDIFNRISEKCFHHCVYTLGHRELTDKEVSCVDRCAVKFLSGGQAIMQTYVEVQPAMTERRIQEMTKLAEEAALNAS